MTTTARLLDQAKEKLGIASDYRLAKCWNVTPQRIGNWRQGVNGLSDDKAVQICEMIGADPGPVLLQLQAERARKSKHPAVAAVFDSLLRKLGPTIAAGLALFVGIPTPADASPITSGLSQLFRQHLTDNDNYAQYATRAGLIFIKLASYISRIIRPRLSLAV